MTDRNYFKGKRVALIGLGPHGELVEDAKFLIKSGALLSIYDLRSEARLKTYLVFLRSIGLANYVCGSIPPDDLLDSDMIVLSSEYPRDSTFLNKAREKGVSIELIETLFFRFAPPLTLVAVIGNWGKATIMSMLAPMLEVACIKEDNPATAQNFFVYDPESGEGILPHLKKAKNGDILLMPVTTIMMAEFYRLRISPHVAVFTSLPHTFEKSPFEILEFQTYNNFLVASDEIIDKTRSFDFKPRAKMLRTKTLVIPPIWDLHLHGHDLMSVALSLQTAKLFRITDDEAQKIIEDWKPLKGRIEFVKKVKGVDFYNDAASRLPHSTQTALNILSRNKNVILICGGAETGLDYADLANVIPQFVHTLILVPGSGTLRQRKILQNIEGVKVFSVPNIEEAARLSKENAALGDRVLYSPAFAAMGQDISRKDRGDKFVKAVRSL